MMGAFHIIESNDTGSILFWQIVAPYQLFLQIVSLNTSTVPLELLTSFNFSFIIIGGVDVRSYVRRPGGG